MVKELLSNTSFIYSFTVSSFILLELSTAPDTTDHNLER